MSVDQTQLNTILLLITIVAGFVYGTFKIFVSKGANSQEQALIYEGLNRALKEEVNQLKVEMADQKLRLDQALVELKSIHDAKADIDNLVVRALREFMAAHPEQIEILKKRKTDKAII